MESLDQPPKTIKHYPNIGQALVLLVICIGLTIIFSMVQAMLSNYISIQASFLLIYVIVFGLTLFVGLRLKRSEEPYFRFSFAGIPLLAYPVLYLVTVSLATLSMPITELIPMPETLERMFEELMGDGNVFMFLAAVVAAPIFEELIFRGIILDGFLRNYSKWPAIIMSSLIFGVAHLNPWQFVVAFLLGIFLGWIYYRTRSILPCIAIHVFANGSSFLATYLFDLGTDDTLADLFGGQSNVIVGMIIAILIVAGGSYLLHRLLQPAPSWEVPSKIDEPVL